MTCIFQGGSLSGLEMWFPLPLKKEQDMYIPSSAPGGGVIETYRLAYIDGVPTYVFVHSIAG